MKPKNKKANAFNLSPVNPYLFVLKEGQKIQDNPFDYSLMLMQVGKPEIIKSPWVNKK